MLTAARTTIYALVDELKFASGDQYFLSVGRRFLPGTSTLVHTAEIRVKTRSGSAPVFCDDGEQCLFAHADTQDEADEKLAALCSVVTAA